MTASTIPSRPFPPAIRVSLPPEGTIGGTVRLPGSKSITNRAIIAGALARGETVLENALFCDDSRYLARALRKLRIAVIEEPDDARIRIQGAAGPLPGDSGEFFLGNAGTSTRFLTAALTLSPGRYVVDGNERMRERPIGDLVRALRELGAEIDAPSGCPPVTVGPQRLRPEPRGQQTIGCLAGGTVVLPGRTSSQFISAVLLAAPLAREDVTVVIDGECVSRPYIDITLEVMRQFKARPRLDEGRPDGRTAFFVPAGRGYLGRTYVVEGDASTASYFLAAAAITGGKIRVEGVGRMSIQGDAEFASVLAKMGCHVKQEEDAIGLAGDLLHGLDVDCRDMPDIVPTLAVVALFARGRTRIRNVTHLRFKESDRIASVATELRKLGGKVRETRDGLEVEESKLRGAVLETWSDHRLAMAFSLVGLRVAGVEIRDPAVVGKSFPEYFNALREIGAEVTP